MNLLALVLYGLLNGTMVLSYLLKKERIYEFPFWAGLLALGWFFPQAIGGYRNIDNYPGDIFSSALLFASLCTVALWLGYGYGRTKKIMKKSWLDAQFDKHRLILAGSILCLLGFYFQWKLSSLPEEMLAKSQWSGASVKYLFLASIFHFGFITLLLIYYNQNKLFVPKLLIFIIPCLLSLLRTAIVSGRRAGMMNLVAYVLVGLWFARRWVLPRWLLMGCLIVGLIIVNSIALYRNIMSDENIPLSKRFENAFNADFSQGTTTVANDSGAEFDNYAFCRKVYSDEGHYYWGLMHWNKLVWNYVPAQVVGRKTKNSLMLDLKDYGYDLAHKRYGLHYLTGTTGTGYKDSFLSFGWFGFIKFALIGWMMGTLYRYAMVGSFLGQLLYIYMLKDAMESISHGTHAILVSSWVYFFALGYPALRWARSRAGGLVPSAERVDSDEVSMVDAAHDAGS